MHMVAALADCRTSGVGTIAALAATLFRPNINSHTCMTS